MDELIGVRELREFVDAGRRFHTLVYGAVLADNSLLASERGDPELIDRHDPASHGGPRSWPPVRQRLIVGAPRNAGQGWNGGRARVANRDALTAWPGASGLVRLDYRWAVPRRMMNDILAPAKAVA